ncbi:hypothetical protein GOODEAATRI_029048 [Goodea atripinnis]|uniref:Uncharacterized protein n=1 Tax=Goodea atripinnis TaxID=208336 RepID=A0ABV0P8P9_9TELE
MHTILPKIVPRVTFLFFNVSGAVVVMDLLSVWCPHLAQPLQGNEPELLPQALPFPFPLKKEQQSLLARTQLLDLEPEACRAPWSHLSPPVSPVVS